MSARNFQKALGHKVNFTIPDDPKAFIQAANAGKPVVQMAGRSSASKALRRIADKLATAMEKPAEKKSKVSLIRLFKKG